MANVTPSIPRDTDSEHAVCSLLLDWRDGIDMAEVVLPILRTVSDLDFFDSGLRAVFQTERQLHNNGEPVTIERVHAAIVRRALPELPPGTGVLEKLLHDVASMCPVRCRAEWYGQQVKAAAIRRALIHACSDIVRLAYDERVPIETITAKASSLVSIASQQPVVRGVELFA